MDSNSMEGRHCLAACCLRLIVNESCVCLSSGHINTKQRRGRNLRQGLNNSTALQCESPVKSLPVWWSPSWLCLNLMVSAQPWGSMDSACLILPACCGNRICHWDLSVSLQLWLRHLKGKQTAEASSSLHTVHRNWLGMCLFMYLSVLVIQPRTLCGPRESYNSPCYLSTLCMSPTR